MRGWPEASNFSDMVNASVWMDHIKCSKEAINTSESGGLANCLGLHRAASLHLFDAMHFEPQPYNPQNRTLPPLGQLQPIEQWGNWMPAGDAVAALAHADRALRGSESPWAWNFMLRFGLHIIGDMHQPLHAGDMYSDVFKDGDQGGNLVTVTGDKRFSSLHFVWDGVGGRYVQNWPISEEALDAEAQLLVKDHPPSDFIASGRLDPAWNDSSK